VGVVKLLTTGGTIATRVDPDTGLSAPALGAADVAGLVPGLECAEILEVNRTPSWAMTLSDMTLVAEAVRVAASECAVAGVVVTVGTSALEYVAYLTDLLTDSSVPVVFTGAMRKADEPSPDGPRNLADAVRVASSPEARNMGVLVVFAGSILSARGAWKFARSSNDAFIDVDGPVGTVDESGIHLARTPDRSPTFSSGPDSTVEILKVYPGADGALLQGVMAREARGVVIEGMPGAGGVPPSMTEALAQLASTDTVVVVSSRAPSGLVPDPPTGGTGSPLIDLPLLSAGPLTTEKAWVLLSLVMGACTTADDARSMFSSLLRGRDD
jgi:L-asparaginase